MISGLEPLVELADAIAQRLDASPSLACRRAWPFAGGRWLALLAEAELGPESTWAVLADADPWPDAVRRLVDRGAARCLADLGIVAWPLAAEPVLEPAPAWPRPLDLDGVCRPGRVVSYKPLRRVVTSFVADDGGAIYYTKYLRPRQARRSLENHRLVASWWRDRARLAPAELLPWASETGRLAWRAACGVAVRDLAAGDLPAAAATAGDCLASLHSCPATLPERRSRADELRTLEAWLELLPPGFGRPTAAADTLRRLRRSSAASGAAAPVLSHGDFHEGQLLLDGLSATLLDLDTLTLAEPELDLGNFLAHLDLLALERPEVAALDLGDRTLEAYLRCRGPGIDAGRLTWYRCATALRIAAVHAPRPETRWLVPRLLDWAGHLAAGRRTEREEIVR